MILGIISKWPTIFSGLDQIGEPLITDTDYEGPMPTIVIELNSETECPSVKIYEESEGLTEYSSANIWIDDTTDNLSCLATGLNSTPGSKIKEIFFGWPGQTY